MSKSIESRIITLITDRLEDALINEAQLFVPVGSDNKSSLSAKAVLSGTYNGTHPRKFEIEVKDANTLHITETTLWANLFTNHAAPIDTDVTFVAGTPLEIASTGISIEIDATAEVGDEWLVRVGKASNTVANVVPHPFDFNELELPSVSVYSTQDDESPIVQGQSDHDASFTVVLCVSPEMFSNGDGYEIKADIRDAINLDRALYDNTDCLADDCYVTTTRLYDASKVSGKAIFMIEFLVKFRTQHTNSRSR